MSYQFTSRISAVGKDMTLARLCLAEEVEAKVRINMILRRADPTILTLAQARAQGFRYNDESKQVCKNGAGCHASEAPWMDWPTALEHGSADCKTLVAEEIAEARLAGVNAQVHMLCYKCAPSACPVCRILMTGQKQTWHVQSLRPNGDITDVSRWFGMPSHPDGDNAVIAPKFQAGLVQRVGW